MKGLKMKNCSFCGNKNLQKTLSEYTYKHNNNYMIFNNVPALKCEFCKEKYYEAKILKQIEKEFFAVQNGKEVSKKISVPVEDFSEVA
jgi:YgiT-type zinc finger domain-containing protein